MFNMVVTQCVTAPLYRLQGTIFSQSEAKHGCSMFEIADATNMAMQRLVTFLVADNREPPEWAVLRLTKHEVYTADENLRYLTQELLRMVAGLTRNCISLQNSGLVPLQRTLEYVPVDGTTESMEAFDAVFAYIHPNKVCCRNKADDNFAAWAGDGTVEPVLDTFISTQDALSISRASVLQTERSHARNQQRSKPRLQRSRGLRRQVATYIVLSGTGVARLAQSTR